MLFNSVVQAEEKTIEPEHIVDILQQVKNGKWIQPDTVCKALSILLKGDGAIQSHNERVTGSYQYIVPQ